MFMGLGMESGDVRGIQCEIPVTECMTRLATKDIHQGHDHCSKLELPREKTPNPIHHANNTYGGVYII